MNLSLIKRIAILLGVVGVLMGGITIFTYDLIKVEWISMMELQPSYRWMEDPLPLPPRSIPIEGPVSIPGLGAPPNPVPADEVSLQRGRQLYAINCAMCHGPAGEGDGVIAAFLQNKPADLTADVVQAKSDGALFLTITNGVTGRMPPLNENLTVRERWDVVNFLRTLKP